MKRRQFIGSIVAAASAPLMPVQLLNAAPAAGGGYAKAVALTRSNACLSVDFLRKSLAVNDAGFHAIVTRLKSEGLVAQAGKHGMFLSKGWVPSTGKIIAQTASAVAKEKLATKNASLSQKAQPASKIKSPAKIADTVETVEDDAVFDETQVDELNEPSLNVSLNTVSDQETIEDQVEIEAAHIDPKRVEG